MRRFRIAALVGALLFALGPPALGQDTQPNLQVKDANGTIQTTGAANHGGALIPFHGDWVLDGAGVWHPILADTSGRPIVNVNGTVAVAQSGSWSFTCSSGCSGGGGGGAVFGPTVVGSAAANPPILLGGTANGAGTGNVEVAKVDASGNVYVDVTNNPTISNTSFGISGTLPAFAATPAFTISGTLPAFAATPTVNAAESGTWTVQPGNTPNTNPWLTADAATVAQASTTSGEKNSLVGGAVTTSAPTYTTGQTNPLSLDTAGNLRTNGSGVTQPVSAAATTPAAGAAHAIVTGGTALTAVTGPVNGCYIVNPATATDEGISATEPLYVNPVTTATTTANNTTTALQAGQSFSCIPGQTTNISVNAATTAHAFVVVKW